jgi:MFS family permease
MDHTKKVSTSKVARKWALIVGIIVGVCILAFIQRSLMPSEPAPGDANSPEDSPLLHAIVFVFLGMIVLGFGAAGYLIVIYTNCFTFNFHKPVLNGMKLRWYFSNIVVSIGLALGPGLILAAFLGPLLAGLGLSTGQADILPVLVFLVGFQILQLWFLIWAPVYRRMIHKRLSAMGITKEQLQGAILVGLSNPANRKKRFAIIEEDMGALWLTPDRMSYRGDMEQFDLARGQIAGIESQEDSRSTSMLAGIAHVILRVRLDDGSIRQIRLHTEGQWTMGDKRRAMDGLAYAIHNWYEGKVAAV